MHTPPNRGESRRPVPTATPADVRRAIDPRAVQPPIPCAVRPPWPPAEASTDHQDAD